MLALMAAGGLSMGMMMHGHFKAVDKAPAPNASTARQTTSTHADTQHAELEPVLEPAVPDTDTSALEPTAAGPLAPKSRPLMAIASADESEVESEEAPAASPYPTTSYAEVQLPTVEDDCTLPQVRTTEPEVAHLRGDLIKTQTR